VTYKGLNVLVTGADGFIGSHLTEALVRRGALVTALSCYNSFDSHGWLDDMPSAVRRDVSVIRGDIRDGAFLRRIMHGQDTVFHLAALIAIPQSYLTVQSYIDTNVLGTLNVLEAARDHCVRRVVHTSTSEVYGTAHTMPISESHPLQAQSPYSASKIGADMLADAFARSFQLPVVVLRPFNTYGPRQSERAIIATVVRQALDPQVDAVMVGDTDVVRDMTFVEDTVEAFLAIGLAPGIEFGQPYNAGSGRCAKISDLISMILDACGSSKPVQHDKTRLRPKNSEVRALLANSDRLTAETGWSAKTQLATGLERTIVWWRTRLEAGKVRCDARYIT